MKRLLVVVASFTVLAGCLSAPVPEGAAPEPAARVERVAVEPPGPSAARYYLQAQKYWDDPNRAIDAYSRAIEIDPGFALAYFSRGQVLRGLGEVRAAVGDFSRAIELDPGLLQAYRERAEVRMWDLGDEGGAEDIRTAYELDPDDMETALFLAGMLEWERPDEAREIYERMVARYPDDAEPRIYRAKFLRQRGEYGPAVEDFDIAFELSGGEPWLLFEAAMTRFAAGDLAGAEANAERIARDYPDTPEASLLRARFEAVSGRPGRAAPHYQAYLETEWADPAVLREAAYVSAALGNADLAVGLLERFLDRTGDELPFRVAKAGVAVLGGREREALALIDSVIRENDWYLPAWVVLAAALPPDHERAPDVRRGLAERVRGFEPSPRAILPSNLDLWVFLRLNQELGREVPDSLPLPF
jgi:tetratricopeptide (TPR) repeat protein